LFRARQINHSPSTLPLVPVLTKFDYNIFLITSMKLLHELLRLELKSTAFIRTQWPEVTEWPSKSGSLVINHLFT